GLRIGHSHLHQQRREARRSRGGCAEAPEAREGAGDSDRWRLRQNQGHDLPSLEHGRRNRGHDESPLQRSRRSNEAGGVTTRFGFVGGLYSVFANFSLGPKEVPPASRKKWVVSIPMGGVCAARGLLIRSMNFRQREQ